ncbi:MAG: hypothetical protein ACTTKH_05585 [Treponema sp.]
MKLKVENEELDFSKYLYCSSSAITVSNNITKLNGMLGSYYKEKEGNMTHRTFAIQGNFEADSLQDVERFRGRVFESLFNKVIMVYLEDASDRYYKCVLDGQVNTSYNQGFEVGRVFTLSFTLLAFLPFAYERSDRVIFDPSTHKDKIILNYKGNVPSLLNIKIEPFDDIVIKKNKTPFIKNKNTFIKLEKDIVLESKSANRQDIFTVNEGLPSINDRLLVGVLDVFSLLTPLLLLQGKNEIEVNIKDVCYNGTDRQSFLYAIEFSWVEMFY